MDKPWKVIFAFVGVFMAGAVFGAFFTLRVDRERAATAREFAGRNEPPRRGQMLQQMGAAIFRQYAQRLNLTDEQRETIQPIVARAEQELQRLRRENFQDTARVMERLHNDVSAVLMPEQRVQLETLKQNMRERLRRAQENRDRRGDGRRGGRPPGAAEPRPADEEPKGN